MVEVVATGSEFIGRMFASLMLASAETSCPKGNLCIVPLSETDRMRFAAFGAFAALLLLIAAPFALERLKEGKASLPTKGEVLYTVILTCGLSVGAAALSLQFTSAVSSGQAVMLGFAIEAFMTGSTFALYKAATKNSNSKSDDPKGGDSDEGNREDGDDRSED
jgi:hypothetical protein